MQSSLLPTSPFTFGEASTHGIGKTALARMLRDGLVIKHRAGLFWDAAIFAALLPQSRHALAAIRMATILKGEYVLAKHSATAVLGLPTPSIWRDGREPIHLYGWTTRNALIGAGLHLYASPLTDAEVVSRGDLLLTSVPRTAVDIARGVSLPKALIALDGALHMGATPQELSTQLARQRGWRGVSQVARALGHADGLAESALESESRGRFVVKGLPNPRLQVPVRGLSGKQYRVDFYWPEFDVIGEADGWGKFGTTDLERRKRFEREKLREDDLRNANHRVVRWTYQTLDSVTEALVALLR